MGIHSDINVKHITVSDTQVLSEILYDVLRLTHYMDPTPGTPKKLSPDPIAHWPLCELEVLEDIAISPDPFTSK